MLIQKTKKTAGSCLMACKKDHHWLNSFAIKNTEGKVSVELGYACFAFWRERYHEIGGTISEIYLGVVQAKVYKTDSIKHLPAFKRYLKFILSESIFRGAFITKRVSDAFRYGIKMDVDAPANCIQAAMTAVRRGWEFPHKLVAWDVLVKGGVAPNFALGLSDFVNQYDKHMSFRPSGSQSGHEAFYFKDVNHLIEGIKQPLKATLKPYNKQPCPGFEVFKTTQHPTDKEYVPEGTFVKDIPLSNKISKRDYTNITILNIPATIENLIRIQKEHNVP